MGEGTQIVNNKIHSTNSTTAISKQCHCINREGFQMMQLREIVLEQQTWYKLHQT